MKYFLCFLLIMSATAMEVSDLKKLAKAKILHKRIQKLNFEEISEDLFEDFTSIKNHYHNLRCDIDAIHDEIRATKNGASPG